MMTVLVTGGAGYVGSHACRSLAHAGYHPVVYDNLSQGHRCFVKWGPLVVGDVLDRRRLDRAIRKYRPDAVMHFAALSCVADSMKCPMRYYRNNVTGTMTLLEAMQEARIPYLVFSSTAAVFGAPSALPIPDDHAHDPVNTYGAGKAMIECILRDIAAATELRSVALRYFNAAGACAGDGIGERHDPETHLIPLVIEAALGMRPHAEIFGTDYDTPDGTAIRDYVHVADLADAHVRALDYLMSGGDATALNLGTETGHSVREVVEAVRRVSGRPVPVIEGPRRRGDPPRLVAAADGALAMLGWQAKHQSLEEIVDTAWRWHAGQAATVSA